MNKVIRHADKSARLFHTKLKKYPQFLKYWDWYPQKTWGSDFEGNNFNTSKLMDDMIAFNTPDLIMAKFFIGMWGGELCYYPGMNKVDTFYLFDVFLVMRTDGILAQDKKFILEWFRESLG